MDLDRNHHRFHLRNLDTVRLFLLLESPASGFDNHDQNAYVNSVRPGTRGGDLMTQWQRENPQIDEFFTNDPRRTEQYNVPFGRVVD